jgi:GNAT superfamily N-acetyltransferase
MRIEGPNPLPFEAAERILRTLPAWFGVEESLYARAAMSLPTFAAVQPEGIVRFLSLQQHFGQAREVHCVAVEAAHRSSGIGKALHAQAERWLASNGARVLQVKTLAASHPSQEYAQTRQFYGRMGYVPLEIDAYATAPMENH